MKAPRLDRGSASDFVPFADRGVRGWAHSDFLSALPSPGWIAAAEPGPGTVLKDSPETTVYRLAPPGWPDEVVVKRYNRAGGLTAWKDLVRTPRAFGCLRQGAGFLREGVPTPAPLAALAQRRPGRRSYLVTRLTPGCRPLPALLEEMSPETRSRRALLEELVALIREMHGRHVYHGDLKPVNVLVRQERGCPILSLVDLDAARIRRRPSWRLAVRDLGQLDSYLRDEVPPGERRTFFRLYTAGWGRGARRKFLAAVDSESRRRERRRCGG